MDKVSLSFYSGLSAGVSIDMLSRGFKFFKLGLKRECAQLVLKSRRC